MEKERDKIISIVFERNTTSVRELVIYKDRFPIYISKRNACNKISLYGTRERPDLTKEQGEAIAKYLFVTDENRDNGVTYLYVYSGDERFKLIDKIGGPRCYGIDFLLFRHCEFFGFSEAEKIGLFLDAEKYLKDKVIVLLEENLEYCDEPMSLFNKGIRSSENTLFFCFHNCPIKEIVFEYIDEHRPETFCVCRHGDGEWSVNGEKFHETTSYPTNMIEFWMHKAYSY